MQTLADSVRSILEGRTGEITVDELERMARSDDRRAIIGILKGLDKSGAGKFISGRRGHPSRFRVERVPTQRIHHLEDGGNGGIQARELYDYPFFLDRKTRVVLQLPIPLTAEEAERISKFVSSLAGG